ncbi:hypothetical protein CkaCkLH20_02057 [Colletotrichum karsti]|uniref:Carcinoembryonic antigen-related cell adhesion molecule 1 n=1 Tax=Colletotrichum karsti TaxID=1095194 RepID=A0A9P6IAF3_9PEZI|nr:uncharacterized protein CkaCkLH20_02057 [Colletotrichum karsti]KAF9880103.1 hypothetical protein CkaCkLH20_02057 [Colletotrichum karsti]
MLTTLPFLLLLATLAAAQSPVKDWDQCYYAKDSPAHPSLVPCLPESDGLAKQDGDKYASSFCCFAGDNCIVQACWDNTTGVTYQYGCNDPTYEHNNCPPKGGLDMGKSPWIGLVRCNDSDNEGFNKFWACNHPDTCGENCPVDPKNPQKTQTKWPETIQNLPPLKKYCDDLGTRVLAFYASVEINSTGGVPISVPTAGKLSPTYPAPLANDATPSSLTRTQYVGTVETSTPSPTNSTEAAGAAAAAALSGGAIAGIAVGSTLGVVAIIAGFFFMWRRRRAGTKGHHDVAAHPTGDKATAYHGATGPAELAPPEEKRYLTQPNTPSTLSDGAGIHRPVSDMSTSTAVPSPLGTPRTPSSPYYQQGQGGYAELSEDARVVHEMPAINERSEMP